jgi:DNA-binding XRE family transcriptional regulator
MATKHSKLDSLQTQRIAAGHSVTTLAKKANVSDNTVRNAENGGDIEPHHAQRIADALGVSLATLGQRVM